MNRKQLHRRVKAREGSTAEVKPQCEMPGNPSLRRGLFWRLDGRCDPGHAPVAAAQPRRLTTSLRGMGRGATVSLAKRFSAHGFEREMVDPSGGARSDHRDRDP